MCALFLAESDEEICVRKRIRRKKVLPDSESEGEDILHPVLEATSEDVGSAEESNVFAFKEKKLHCIYKAPQGTDESCTDDLLDNENLATHPQPGSPGLALATSVMPGGKHKSCKTSRAEKTDEEERGSRRKRRTEKEKKMKAIRQLKKKERKWEQKV